LTWINTTWSQQAATVTPSSPAVVSSGNSQQATRQTATQDVSRQILPPAPVQQAAPKQPDPRQQTTTMEAMKSAAEQIESYLRSIGRALEFSIDEDTGRTVVTVRDSATGETIRQIPSEEALRLAHALGNKPNALIDLAV
jgi:flagellar protein FlaG